MPTFIALLRGINVGKAKRVTMADLRAVLGGLGYTDVATLLNSGNAVFRAAKGTPVQHAARIAAAISGELGVEVPVIVKSARELDAIVAESPIAVDDTAHSRYLVAFVQDAATLSQLEALEPLIVPPEEFVIGSKAAYLYFASGILESKAGEALLGKVGKATTTRNWATLLKLQALAHTAGA